MDDSEFELSPELFEGNSAAAPITRGRIKDALERERVGYRVDQDLDISTKIGESWVWYSIASEYDEEVLVVRAWWARELSLAQRADALEAANRINCVRHRAMAHVTDSDDVVRIGMDANASCQAGITDAQLDAHLRGALRDMMSAFDWLATHFDGLEAAQAALAAEDQEPRRG